MKITAVIVALFSFAALSLYGCGAAQVGNEQTRAVATEGQDAAEAPEKEIPCRRDVGPSPRTCPSCGSVMYLCGTTSEPYHPRESDVGGTCGQKTFPVLGENGTRGITEDTETETEAETEP